MKRLLAITVAIVCLVPVIGESVSASVILDKELAYQIGESLKYHIEPYHYMRYLLGGPANTEILESFHVWKVVSKERIDVGNKTYDSLFTTDDFLIHLQSKGFGANFSEYYMTARYSVWYNESDYAVLKMEINLQEFFNISFGPNENYSDKVFVTKEVTYDPPIITYSIPFEEGDTWEMKYEKTENGEVREYLNNRWLRTNKIHVTENLTDTYRAVGSETITTKAGTFECLKIEYTTSGSENVTYLFMSSDNTLIKEEFYDESGDLLLVYELEEKKYPGLCGNVEGAERALFIIFAFFGAVFIIFIAVTRYIGGRNVQNETYSNKSFEKPSAPENSEEKGE